MKKAKSVRIINDYTQKVIFDGNLTDYKQFCRDRLNYYPKTVAGLTTLLFFFTHILN